MQSIPTILPSGEVTDALHGYALSSSQDSNSALTYAELALRNFQLSILQDIPLPTTAASSNVNTNVRTNTRRFEVSIQNHSPGTSPGSKAEICISSKNFARFGSDIENQNHSQNPRTLSAAGLVQKMYIPCLPLSLVLRLLLQCDDSKTHWLTGFDIIDAKGRKIFFPYHPNLIQGKEKDGETDGEKYVVFASEVSSMDQLLSWVDEKSLCLQSPLSIAPITSDIQTQQYYRHLKQIFAIQKWAEKAKGLSQKALKAEISPSDESPAQRYTFFGLPKDPRRPNPIHSLFTDVILEILSFADISTLVALSGTTKPLAALINFGITDLSSETSFQDEIENGIENRETNTPHTLTSDIVTEEDKNFEGEKVFEFYLHRWVERGPAAATNLIRRLNDTTEYLEEHENQKKHTEIVGSTQEPSSLEPTPLLTSTLTSQCWVIHPSHLFLTAASVGSKSSKKGNDNEEGRAPREAPENTSATTTTLYTAVETSINEGIKCQKIRISGTQSVHTPFTNFMEYYLSRNKATTATTTTRSLPSLLAPAVAALCRSYEYHQKVFGEVLQPWYAAALHQQNMAALNDMLAATQLSNTVDDKEHDDNTSERNSTKNPILFKPSEVLVVPRPLFEKTMMMHPTSAPTTAQHFYPVSTKSAARVRVPVPLSGFRAAPWPINSVDELKVGMKIDALDTVRKWYASTIVEIDPGNHQPTAMAVATEDGSSTTNASRPQNPFSPWSAGSGAGNAITTSHPRIKIHYDVWGNRWDEWMLLFVDSVSPAAGPALAPTQQTINPRLAPLYSQSVKPQTNASVPSSVNAIQAALLHHAPSAPPSLPSTAATNATATSYSYGDEGSYNSEEARQLAYPGFNFIRSELRPFMFCGTSTGFPFESLARMLTSLQLSYDYSTTAQSQSQPAGNDAFKALAISLFPHLLSDSLNCKIAAVSEGLSGIDHALESQFIKKDKLAEWLTVEKDDTGAGGGPKSISISATFSANNYAFSGRLKDPSAPRMVMAGATSASGGALGTSEWLSTEGQGGQTLKSSAKAIETQSRLPITAPIGEAKVFMVLKVVPPSSSNVSSKPTAINVLHKRHEPYDVVGFAIIRYGRDQPSYGGI